jgi:putative spermidine/putrescine transport system substrate-binding protein
MLRRVCVVVTALCVLAGATTGALAVAGGSKKTTITFAGFGGTSQDAEVAAWMKPFMALHPNISVREDSPNDYGKIKTMVLSHHVTWDVVHVGNDFGLSPDSAKLLEKIDCKVVECKNLQPQKLLTTGYRVPLVILSVVLGYNTKALNGAVPANWADFFDVKKFPGKRAMWKWSGSGIIEAALLADGVSPARLYPLDVKRALDKIASIKGNIIWFDSPAQCTQLLADGEASMATCPNGRVYTARQDGAPVAIQWNQALNTADYLVIPKGTKHLKEAMSLVAYITSAAHNAAYSYQLPYAPANVKSAAKVNPATKQDQPTTYLKQAVFINDRWYAANGADLDKQFQTWIQGQ